jgi:hypothetical protein
MRPEPPIFLLSEDNAVLDVRRGAEDAEYHLTQGHTIDGRLNQNLLLFDGLARPVSARSAGDRLELEISQPISDAWQVRARAVETIRRRRAWVAEQGDTVVIGGQEFPSADVQDQLSLLDGVNLDSSFAEFTQVLVNAFIPGIADHSGSWLHNLFHG